MIGLGSNKMRTVFLAFLLIAPLATIMILGLPRGAQSQNFGGPDCDLYPIASNSEYHTPSCSQTPQIGGSETRSWTLRCEQFCGTGAPLAPPEGGEKVISATATGACLRPPLLTDCPWIWIQVGNVSDLHFQAIWRNGTRIREKVQEPGTPGYVWEERCDYSATESVDAYCLNCGHPCEEPIIVSLRDGRYELTDTAGGVWFDLSADGKLQRLPWTARGSDDAFLVLDRNSNGVIDNGTELFSHVSPQPPPGEGEVPHGFRALAVFDQAINGGNSDGQITSDDLIYPHLRLWHDIDHNGETNAGELLTLAGVGLQSVSLAYTDRDEHRDRFGNVFKFSAEAQFLGGRHVDAWVVYFNLEACPSCEINEPETTGSL